MLGWIIGALWVVVFPVLLAALVTTVLQPAVSWLRRRNVPSGVAAFVVMITFVSLIVALVAILTPRVAGQAPALVTSASGGLQRIRDWLTDGPLGLSDGQVTRAIAAAQDKLRESASAISSGVFSTLGAATSALVNLILVLMLTFYFLKDGHRFRPWVAKLGGESTGLHVTELMQRTWRTLGGFIRTQSLIALIDAFFIGVGLTLLDVPLAIPLAVVTFLGAFIPIIGALVSGILAVLVALVSGSAHDALFVLLLVLGVQQLEGNVISPWLQGKNLNLNAAVVLLAVALGGSIWGVTGAFLAVPAAATMAEVFRYVNEQIMSASTVVEPADPAEPAT